MNLKKNELGGLPQRDLQQLWFSIARQPWMNLALVPGDGGFSARGLAERLIEVAELQRSGSVVLLDGEGLALQRSSALILQLTDQSANVRRLVVLDSVVTNQAGIPVALAADGVLLVVKMGNSTVPAAQRTLELLRPERVIGCVTLDAGGGSR